MEILALMNEIIKQIRKLFDFLTSKPNTMNIELLIECQYYESDSTVSCNSER